MNLRPLIGNGRPPADSTPIRRLRRSLSEDRAITPDEPLQPLTDRELTLLLIDELGARAEHAVGGRTADAGLPNPLATDRNLGLQIDRVTSSQSRLTGIGLGRPATPATVLRLQTRLNDALVHIIHQLDHRDRQQRTRIGELEAAMAETMRRTRTLEQRLSARTAVEEPAIERGAGDPKVPERSAPEPETAG